MKRELYLYSHKIIPKRIFIILSENEFESTANDKLKLIGEDPEDYNLEGVFPENIPDLFTEIGEDEEEVPF